MTLGAYIIFRNEPEYILAGCIDRLLPFVDELLLVDHGSTNETWKMLQDFIGKRQADLNDKPRIVAVQQPYTEPIDMGALRTRCYEMMRSDWILNVDADEYYPAESLKVIRAACENSGEAISFRVPYLNLAWRPGYVQDQFEHYPDRIYRRDVVEAVKGLLPNDMHYVKEGFFKVRPILEYDNPQDASFENPVQPILRNAPYYHLARTRGYHFEYTKWKRYNKNLHPEASDADIEQSTRINQWVSGLYPVRSEGVPEGIPKRNIFKPIVSVIIPNFQYAQYVGETIQSCLDQTYPVHEIIVVDDFSYDNSVDVINKFIADHPSSPIRLIRQNHNSGVAAARNAGIAQSSGDFFICLDADDKLDPTYVEKTVAVAITTDAEIVYTGLEFFDQQQGTWEAPEPTIENMRQWQIVPSTCALVERHCFDGCGGFNISTVYEDWDFWCNLMIKQGYKFVRVNEPLFKYRKHGPSRINELDKQQRLGFWQLKQEYGVTREPDQ